MDNVMTVPFFSGENLKIQIKKKNGDFVRCGEMICTIEYDVFVGGSVEMELDAFCDGKITWLVKDNAEIDFDQKIAVIECPNDCED